MPIKKVISSGELFCRRKSLEGYYFNSLGELFKSSTQVKKKLSTKNNCLGFNYTIGKKRKFITQKKLRSYFNACLESAKTANLGV